MSKTWQKTLPEGEGTGRLSRCEGEGPLEECCAVTLADPELRTVTTEGASAPSLRNIAAVAT